MKIHKFFISRRLVLLFYIQSSYSKREMQAEYIRTNEGMEILSGRIILSTWEHNSMERFCLCLWRLQTM